MMLVEHDAQPNFVTCAPEIQITVVKIISYLRIAVLIRQIDPIER